MIDVTTHRLFKVLKVIVNGQLSKTMITATNIHIRKNKARILDTEGRKSIKAGNIKISEPRKTTNILQTILMILLKHTRILLSKIRRILATHKTVIEDIRVLKDKIGKRVNNDTTFKIFWKRSQ